MELWLRIYIYIIIPTNIQSISIAIYATNQLLWTCIVLNSNVKYGNIKYIDCGGYGTLATFSIGKLLYCKFNGVDKVSEVKQQNIAQLPSEYTLNSSIGVYMSALVRDQNTGSLQISTDGKITLYCPYPYLYGYVIMPIK